MVGSTTIDCHAELLFKILTGHEKGVLSLSWCKQDADLLLSCGKDNRALCWNPQTSEIIGEVSCMIIRPD
jgi:WD40 repeat protein